MHSKNTEVRGHRRFWWSWSEAAPVILDTEKDGVCGFLKGNAHLAGGGVFDGIGECFLGDAQQVEIRASGQWARELADFQRD